MISCVSAGVSGDEGVDYVTAVAEDVAQLKGGDLACLFPTPERATRNAEPLSGLRFGEKND